MRIRRSLTAALTAALVAPVLAVSTSPAVASATTAETNGTVAAKASPKNRLHAKPLPRPRRGTPAPDAHAKGKVLVTFKKAASQAARDKAVKGRGAKAVGRIPGTDVVELRTTGSAQDLAIRLRTDPSVAAVSLDYTRKASVAPNDLAYTYGDQPYLSTVRMPTAWDRQKGSTAQVIAVLDSGVYGGHPDLAGRVLAGFNTITNLNIAAGAASDDNGHGSMVAGIAGANTNNTEGIAGVAWTARIMPVKVLDADGNGNDSDLIQGLHWATDHGAKVINMSLGGPGDSPLLHDAVKYAVSKGVVVVAAAGNTYGDEPEYPAAYPEAIAVGATDSSGRITDFSTHGDWVDVAAPGFDIVSTWRTYDYYVGAGTSFSAPIVSGIAALVRSSYPTYTPAQVAARLRSTARDAGPRGIDPFYGVGIVDATYAVGGTWAADFAQPSLGSSEPNDVAARATPMAGGVSGTIGGEGDVDWYRYESTYTRGVEVTARPPAYDDTLPQNVDIMMAVYDKDLRLVGEADSYVEGGVERLDFTMGKGTYYVAVRNYNGSRDARAYTLDLEDTSLGVFDPVVHLTVPPVQYSSTAIGDMTGDGLPDIVASAQWDASAQVVVLPQRADGGFGPAQPYQTADSTLANNLVLADLDGDGRKDVVVSTSVGVQVLTQSATGSLDAAKLLPGSPAIATNYLAVADLDGDGIQEVVTSTPDGVGFLDREEDGTWSRTGITAYASPELEIGDLDGDGRPDIAAIVPVGEQLRVLRNTVDGWVTTDLAGTVELMYGGIEVADVSGDGRADLIAVSGGVQPKLRILRQSPDGSLADPVIIPIASSPDAVEAADVDGDGRLDILAPHGGYHQVSVVIQNADGSFAEPRPEPVTPASSYDEGALALGDVTNDGMPDAVLASYQLVEILPHSTGPTPGTEQLWVQSTTPADFGSGMTLTYTPTVTFQRNVDPASVNSSTVGLLNGRTGARVAASVTYDPSTKVAKISPAAPLYDAAAYRLVVSGVTDGGGTPMDTAFSTTFRTTDVTPPAAGSFTATGALRAATLSWKAPAITDLDAYVVRMAASATPPASVTSGTALYSGTGTSVTASNLTGTTYSFRIWVKDRSGKFSAAATAKLVGSAVTMSSNVTSLTYGGSVTVSGKVTRRDTGAALAGVPVELYWRRVGTATWTLTTTRTSSSTGAVSFAHKPTASVDYMWVYRGSTAYVGSSSALRRVGVKTALTATASRTSFALGGTFTLSGAVSPSHAGKTVYLQRYAGSGTWTTVTSKVLSTTSTYSFTVKPTTRGTVTYRVYKPADTDHLAGYSANRAVKVT